MKHQIYYDDTCPFCIRWKERIERWDKKHIFKFLPLGKPSDTLILIENSGRKFMRSKAVLRILYLLGFWLPGCLYVLPSWLIDPIYRIIASHRTCK